MGPIVRYGFATVAASFLAMPAVYSQDIEVGEDDFQISFMGEDGNFVAGTPSAAYNAQDGEYFVVWSGKDDDAPLDDEVYGQRIEAGTGLPIGPALRISFQGPNHDSDYFTSHPTIAWNSDDNEYLVAWTGTRFADFNGSENEIFGKILDAEGNTLAGPIRISDMGPEDDTAYYGL
jgi:hypothetical protein